ncbi:LOB domain-containing protein 20 [Tripterygium wilfordii]|uniref:LOB domain-containing protein 20 n=1 Tax=Tripterygium wilfordii TaxID=458696 RepID=A0A7J7CM71_TRIWF|nr:LOB domain-containing protein 20-like [Tripterygium wilfordii]KAF5735173.1 LOB domain-containing protein 20 [Tripterygium wilfordii]
MADHGRPYETTRRKGVGKPTASAVEESDHVVVAPNPTAPCGACKFLRRKCINGCIFSPHFGSDQGAARFAAVHKVFGASNVSKLLLHIPVLRRHDAVVTISYEAQARLSDPVYGCVSTILALQQQVASMQEELAMVQAQLINSRLAMANTLQEQNHHYFHNQQQQIAMLQPSYSNNSSASTTNLMINTSTTFTSNFDLENAPSVPSSHSMEPVVLQQQHFSRTFQDEESRIPVTFANEMLHRREVL